MRWQDPVLFVASIAFIVSLGFTIWRHGTTNRALALLTTFGMAAVTVVDASLGLWLGATASAVVTIEWGIILRRSW